MKKTALLVLVLLGVSAAAFAEVRLDIGFDVPRGIGGVVDGEADISDETVDFFNTYIFPFPEAGIYYQESFGPLRVGGGLRVFTFILESIYWPNVYVEYDVWKMTLALQMGGGVFGLFGLYNTLEAGQVFLPDLSAWFRIGDTFRVGGGALGLLVPELTDGMGFVYYLGAKFAVKL